MSQRAVIFDMDGVLVDSYRAHLFSWQRTAERHGLTMTEQQFASTFGRTAREVIGQLWPGRFENGQIAQLDAEKEQAYRDLLQRDFPEMPGAGELIEALHSAGFALAIGSSGPAENVAMVLRCLPAGKLISATVDGTQVKHGKPDPEVFLLAAKKLGVSPSQCAVIEDAPVGIEAARRAGMVAIGITGTAGREALAKRAHRVVDSLTELTSAAIAELIGHVKRET